MNVNGICDWCGKKHNSWWHNFQSRQYFYEKARKYGWETAIIVEANKIKELQQRTKGK